MAVAGVLGVALVAWRRIRGRVGSHWRFGVGGRLARRVRVVWNIIFWRGVSEWFLLIIIVVV